MRECTVERFLRDVAEHKMEIIREDDVNRHVRFKKPGSSAYYFDLITWPGALCITGDMGTYVIQRTHDMFEFFRTDRQYARPDKPLPINLSYWSEKLEATDCNGRRGGSATEFDPDKFRWVINEFRVGWMRRLREMGASKEDRRELWEAVDDEVLCYDEDQHCSLSAAYGFSRRVGGKAWQFDDLFECNFERYTFHFTWICYALTWGIMQYDEAKERQEVAA
jgi:hypothetical protein